MRYVVYANRTLEVYGTAIGLEQTHEILNGIRERYIEAYGPNYVDAFYDSVSYSPKWVYDLRMSLPLVAFVAFMIVLMLIFW